MTENPDEAEVLEVRPYEIPKSTRADMASIIMIGSEIDDLFTVAIAKLAKIDPSTCAAMLGQTPISTKTKKLDFFLSNDYSGIKENFANLIRNDMTIFTEHRNAIAHGVYVGAIDNSLCFFTTNKMNALNEEFAVFILARIKESKLKQITHLGRRIAKNMREIFNIGPLNGIYPYTLRREKFDHEAYRNKNIHQ